MTPAPFLPALITLGQHGTRANPPPRPFQIADKYLGYLKTISVFSTIYVCGMCLVTASAYPPFTEWAKENGNPIPQLMSLVGLLGFVALGAGGIKPVVIVLGAEQFELPKEAAEKDSFFNYFYWRDRPHARPLGRPGLAHADAGPLLLAGPSTSAVWLPSCTLPMLPLTASLTLASGPSTASSRPSLSRPGPSSWGCAPSTPRPAGACLN